MASQNILAGPRYPRTLDWPFPPSELVREFAVDSCIFETLQGQDMRVFAGGELREWDLGRIHRPLAARCRETPAQNTKKLEGRGHLAVPLTVFQLPLRSRRSAVAPQRVHGVGALYQIYRHLQITYVDLSVTPVRRRNHRTSALVASATAAWKAHWPGRAPRLSPRACGWRPGNRRRSSPWSLAGDVEALPTPPCPYSFWYCTTSVCARIASATLSNA